MNELAIRYFNEKGKALKTAIEDAVKDTQRIVVRPFPDKILMTRKQYKDLSGVSDIMVSEYEGQEFYLYRTPQNVMEVEIKDGN